MAEESRGKGRRRRAARWRRRRQRPCESTIIARCVAVLAGRSHQSQNQYTGGGALLTTECMRVYSRDLGTTHRPPVQRSLHSLSASLDVRVHVVLQQPFSTVSLASAACCCASRLVLVSIERRRPAAPLCASARGGAATVLPRALLFLPRFPLRLGHVPPCGFGPEHRLSRSFVARFSLLANAPLRPASLHGGGVEFTLARSDATANEPREDVSRPRACPPRSSSSRRLCASSFSVSLNSCTTRRGTILLRLLQRRKTPRGGRRNRAPPCAGGLERPTFTCIFGGRRAPPRRAWPFARGSTRRAPPPRSRAPPLCAAAPPPPSPATAPRERLWESPSP